jgi:hypothetical protein
MNGLTKEAVGFEPGGRDAFRATVTRALAESTVRDRNLQGDAEGYALRAGTSFQRGDSLGGVYLEQVFPTVRDFVLHFA